MSIPAAPANPTLNLAQAVLLVAYELYVARGTPGAIALEPVSRATVFQIDHLFGRLQELLAEVGFARDTTIRRVTRDLRQLLARAGSLRARGGDHLRAPAPHAQRLFPRREDPPNLILTALPSGAKDGTARRRRTSKPAPR